MNLAVIDDLESDLLYLKQLLSDYFIKKRINHTISSFYSGEEFLAAYRPGLFDAVFLDNLMSGMNGIETARCLRSYDTHIPIIFITTEESYALDGYTVQAMDYILKPVAPERLASVMDRLTLHYRPSKFIEIRENRFDRRLLLDDIQYVRSVGHFLEIHTEAETLKPYMTMENLLSLLEQMGEYGNYSRGLRFQNCCRGYVVNLEHVRSLGSKDFILSCGGIVPVSRPKYKEMQAAYAAYLFAKTRLGQ